MKKALKKQTFKEMTRLWGGDEVKQLQGQMEAPGVWALILFENMTLDSSDLGARAIMSVGPDCTYKLIEDVADEHLEDLPSRRKYAQSYCLTEAGLAARYEPDFGNEKPEEKPLLLLDELHVGLYTKIPPGDYGSEVQRVLKASNFSARLADCAEALLRAEGLDDITVEVTT